MAGVAADRCLIPPRTGTTSPATSASTSATPPQHCAPSPTAPRSESTGIGERSFVNNISFGLYADAVNRPEYRDAKTTTLLDRVPTFAGPTAAASGLRCTSAGHPGVIDPTIVVVSNNAYLPGGLTTPRTRPSLQQGVLGVLSLHPRSGLDLALLALAGPGPVEGNATWIAPHAMVSASTPTVTAAVDGEPVDIPAPVRASRPAALRMRLPRHRPTTHPASTLHPTFAIVRPASQAGRTPTPHPDWAGLWQQATHPAVPVGEGVPTWTYYAIALLGAAMTPYEVFFFSSGGVEEHWGPKNPVTARLNVFVGFPLGGLLSLSIMARGGPPRPGRDRGRSAQPGRDPGRAGRRQARSRRVIAGFFAATFGTAMEKSMSCNYAVAQYSGGSAHPGKRPGR